MTAPKASDIRVGDHLRLTEAALGFEFIILAAGQPGREVVEVGSDFIVLGGEGAVIRTRVPKYLFAAPAPAPHEAPAGQAPPAESPPPEILGGAARGPDGADQPRPLPPPGQVA